jgi:GT2 family glycosyltransferase
MTAPHSTCGAAVASRPHRPPVALTFAVVICVYTEDRFAQILSAIDSVTSQSRPADEVVVVVDHNDALAERLRGERPDVRVSESLDTRGLSGARNHGVSVTTSDVVVFLDDDAVGAPDWLEQLSTPYADPDVIAVGGLIRPMWATGRPRFMPPEFDWVVGCSYVGLPTSASTVRNVIGANMSFRRSALQAAGGFSTDLGRVGTRPAGCEETELSIRARRAIPGGEVVFQPTAIVDHHVPASRARLRYFLARCHAEGGSKALVVREAGAGAGLQSERAYTTRVLPRGVARGVLDTITRHDAGGLLRATTIVLGLATTTLGYAQGRIRLLTIGRRRASVAA